MLEHLFPKFHPRYAASPYAQHLRLLAEWLVAKGYALHPVRGHVCRLRQALERSGTMLDPSAIDRRFLQQIFSPWPGDIMYRATHRAFVRCLVDHGLLPVEPDPSPHAGLVGAYRNDLVVVRGLSESTVHSHLYAARVLLEAALPTGAAVAELSAAAVERHIISMSKRLSRQSMQHYVGQIRSFLRFCHDRGVIDKRLDGIDTVRTYRDELPPRALPWQMVTQLLRSIDRRSTAGWRDYAILHLMAFYGLRPSEVVALRLDSIDWQAKTLRVEQRKTRSALILPLDDRTGRILTRYLKNGRPGSDRPELFVRARTPSGPIKNTAVVELFHKRVRASGLPINGATSYSLRHSFAMRLLGRGVGIKAIGDVLGHRSLEATCVYLRLHTEALRDVALPLPRASVRQ